MSYDSIDDYVFWTWVEAYPVSGWAHRLLVLVGLCRDDQIDIDRRIAGRA